MAIRYRCAFRRFWIIRSKNAANHRSAYNRREREYAKKHNIELKPGKGGQLARSAGNSAQILGREGKYVLILNDPIHKKVLDILPSRKKEHLIQLNNHLSEYPKSLLFTTKYI